MANVDVDAALLLRLRQSDLFQDYQKAFEGATGLPLMLREIGSFRTPLQDSKKINRFCSLLNRADQSCSSCLYFQQHLEEKPMLKPRTMQCHAGLNESAVPVQVGNRVLGYLQTGQVFFKLPPATSFDPIAISVGGKNSREAREIKSAYFQTRVLNRKQYESAISLLAIFAVHLAAVSNQIMMTEEAAEPSAVTRSRLFIAKNHNEQLSLNEVAGSLKMSVCYFCRVFKKGTGLTFTEYLARERIESVKRLLLNANMRVSEAAFAAGFQSLSQFNRVFRRVEGESPSTYRERLHGIGRQTRGCGLTYAA